MKTDKEFYDILEKRFCEEKDPSEKIQMLKMLEKALERIEDNYDECL